MSCVECDRGVKHLHCPAGGPHTWGTVEQAGTGRTWGACLECGTPTPPHPDDEWRIVRRRPDPGFAPLGDEPF